MAEPGAGADVSLRMRKTGFGASAAAVAVALAMGLCAPRDARAFCGFYVKERPGELKSPATSVILMRVGRTTVLSMQNDYEGPVEDFAMVVPVPTAIDRENVKTLPRDVFTKVEELSAPRLVEYWEEEPWCFDGRGGFGYGSGAGYGARGDGSAVSVHARFAVGEYDVVVLSSADSMALESWLTSEGYRIPAGAAELLRPYVEAGSHFFVAKVDASRVAFENGRARLSPLRIHYDADTFSLPVRLGLANSGGQKQDLLVHILASERYEVANYPNVFAPTNIRVRNATKGRFASFYASVFDRVLERAEGAVVTEYSWSASSCDPCPGPTLDQTDFLTLGADVAPDQPSFTLTRLHYRYDRDDLHDDLVFRPARPVVGGTGMPDDRHGRLDATITENPGGLNSFQSRFVILHNRRHDVAACPPPGYWVRSWGGDAPSGRSGVKPALDISRARRGLPVEDLLLDAVPSLGFRPRRTGGARPRATRLEHGLDAPILPPGVAAPVVVDERGFLTLG